MKKISLLVVLLVCFDSKAMMCDYVSHESPNYFQELEERSDLIFIGTVDYKERTVSETQTDEKRVSASKTRFSIDRKLSEFEDDFVYVNYEIRGCSCDPLFEIGEQYIVFGSSVGLEHEGEKYYTYACLANQNIKENPEYLKYKSNRPWSTEKIWNRYKKKLSDAKRRLKKF